MHGIFLYIDVTALRQILSRHPFNVRNCVISFEHNTEIHSSKQWCRVAKHW